MVEALETTTKKVKKMAENNFISGGFFRDRDNALKITVTQNADATDVVNVTLVGRIDNYNTAFFQEKVDSLIADGARKILFCCSSLEYVSSSGFGIFANCQSKLKQDGGMIAFFDLQTKVMEVFHLLGFDHIYALASDLNEIPRIFEGHNFVDVAIFPKAFNCPVCVAKLRASKAGTFRCSSCKVIININSEGVVTLK